MKWLKNIFGKKLANEDVVFLPLAEINSWLEEREEDPEFAMRLEVIYGSINDVAEALSRDISTLASVSADDSTSPKLLRAGLAARGEVVKQLATLCEKLMPPKKNDLDSASQHHWTLVKGLKRTMTTFGRAQRYAAALFPRNIESISSDLAQISRMLVDLESEIGKRRRAAEESWYSRELAERLQVELLGINELKKKTLQDEATLVDIDAQLSGLEDDARRLKASDEGKRAQELKRSLEKNKEEKSQAEDELSDLIAPLIEALARIMKQGSSDRINLRHKNVFEQLLVYPYQVQDKDIAGSLKELQSHLARLGLNNKKKEKILDHINLLIEKRSLESAWIRQQSLETEILDLESHIRESRHEELGLREEMCQARKSKKSLDAALDQSKKDLASLEEKVASDKFKLDERLSRIAGKPVKLDFSPERQ